MPFLHYPTDRCCRGLRVGWSPGFHIIGIGGLALVAGVVAVIHVAAAVTAVFLRRWSRGREALAAA